MLLPNLELKIGYIILFTRPLTGGGGWFTKPKARSGQVRKFSCFDWLDCQRMTRVLSPAHAMACAIHSVQSLQFFSNKSFR